MAVHGHFDGDDGENLARIEGSRTVEYVGGPYDGRFEDLRGLPESIAAGDGRYRRSVRCAEDGAMRYVWIALESDGRT